jgi:putative ABC transport system permease protein
MSAGSPHPRPPRFARRLLEAALPEDVREHVLGDLAELFAQRRAVRGALAAWVWYWAQTLSFSVRFGWERLVDGSGSFSWLDLKLGLRMLAKYPGLSAVGVLALTVAITISAAWFEFAGDYGDPELPLPGGERIVGILVHDLEAGAPVRATVHDFVAWRDQLRSIEELAAFRNLERNLVTADGRSEPLRGVEMSAAGFRVAGVPPLLGRPIVEDDETLAAPPVVVLGYGVWQSRFEGSGEVIGRVVQIGDARATVVGVMPEGFAFPMNQELWAPLRLNPLAYELDQSPTVRVFGRLTPSASPTEAQAELGAVGQRATAESATGARLRLEVRPYVQTLLSLGRAEPPTDVVFGLVFLVICANVGTLIFARTATRAGEIVVRSALGASRRRIVLQLFAEALVLALVSAALGLLVVTTSMKWGMDLFWAVQGGVDLRPFWWNDTVSATTVLYVMALAVAAAVIAGVIPALKITGRGMAARLRQATAGGAGMRFGGVWTAIIVSQVAITVAFLPVAFGEAVEVIGLQRNAPNYALDELLSARLFMDADGSSGRSEADAPPPARLAELQEELGRRIAAEPGVIGVAFANGLPSSGGAPITIQTEGSGRADEAVHRARVTKVDADFFPTLGTPLLLGRGFERTDLSAGRNAVIVNESFVRRVFAGANPIGQRLRSIEGNEAPAITYEVVGVVPDLGGAVDAGADPARLYRLSAPGTIQGARLAVRFVGAPTEFAPRLRQITAELSPSLRLYEVESLAQIGEAEKRSYFVFLGILALVGGVALLLSTVGVHSLMSFAVSQRTREIGIRAALGAQPRRIVTAIFSRAVLQLTAGVGVGATLVLLTADETPFGQVLLVLGMVAALMMAVGLAACVVPVRRALRIQPTEALRGER